VQFLGVSTEVVLRLLGIGPSREPSITAEEVGALVKEGTQAGVFEEAEHDMIKRVFRLADRRASTLMTPRAEVVWLDAADPPGEIQRKITTSPHSRFPVCDGTLDNILGVVGVKDLLVQGFRQQPFALKGLLRVPLFLYEGTSALRILETFKAQSMHLAVVLDEYGAVQGLLTLNDIVEALVGDLSVGADPAEPKAVRRPDGSWLLDGALPVDEFHDALEGAELPKGDYQTLAGFILIRLGRIPATGDRFEWQGLGFEVVDMDGNRIDKVLVTPSGGPAAR
jgi:putative hemolysin